MTNARRPWPMPGAVDGRGELLEPVDRGPVDDRVDGVEAQTVEVELGDPAGRVVDDEAADRVAAGVVDVHGLAPRRVVGVGEVGPEVAEVVALGSVVVVDDVEEHAEATVVRGVDEPAQPVGPAVGVLHRVGQHPVVAPVPPAGELPHRHQLERGDAEVAEVVEPVDDRVEGAGGRERADVQLVDHLLVQRPEAPAVVAPREAARVVDRRRTVEPLGLVPGRGVGAVDRVAGVAVQPVPVGVARPDAVDDAGVVAGILVDVEGDRGVPVADDLDRARQRRPHEEGRLAIPQVGRAERSHVHGHPTGRSDVPEGARSRAATPGRQRVVRTRSHQVGSATRSSSASRSRCTRHRAAISSPSSSRSTRSRR